LAHIGPVALAVTTNVSINFLRRPPPGPLLARGRLLKLGRRLAVVDVTIAPPEEDEAVAQATATYSIPPSDDRPV
jgi:acyl-coenzyme A thioesterase PaaI-like protein